MEIDGRMNELADRIDELANRDEELRDKIYNHKVQIQRSVTEIEGIRKLLTSAFDESNSILSIREKQEHGKHTQDSHESRDAMYPVDATCSFLSFEQLTPDEQQRFWT